ncbi:unnamed protein product [Urochloa humidicola]
MLASALRNSGGDPSECLQVMFLRSRFLLHRCPCCWHPCLPAFIHSGSRTSDVGVGSITIQSYMSRRKMLIPISFPSEELEQRSPLALVIFISLMQDHMYWTQSIVY